MYLGIFPDAVNVVYNATKAKLGVDTGTWTDAAISSAAMVPIVGDLAMASKIGKEVTEIAIKNKKIIQQSSSELIDGLQHAGEYGIKTDKELKAATKGKAKDLGIEVHHLIEKRFAGILEGTKNTKEYSSAVLTKAEHLEFTNAWRKAIPYGTTTDAKTVRKAAENIYENFPKLKEAAMKEFSR